MSDPKYYPIIYVRGYAGSQAEIEDTVATPHMGFNVGSTKYRQDNDKKVYPWVFESPLLRLMKEHGYVDAYRNGQLLPEGPIPRNSVWIFRYYDITSKDLGKGQRKEIEVYAKKLREFILHVRKAVDGDTLKDDFRVYLVAHSMGGLICRCYLQNPKIPGLDGKTPGNADKKGMDKLFTYATPHGGIDLRNGLGWIDGLRDFLDINNSASFGPERMRKILALAKGDDLRSLKNRFPVERAFSLVGTDSHDYAVAGGMVRKAVGPMSDGLVQIKNAYVYGGPSAFVHRSHSGQYGIVNSEEGYQNLQRFLFGDTRATLYMEDVRTKLPATDGITASYYIEVEVSIRGIPVKVHRRTVDTESAIMLSKEQLESKSVFIHTAFLSMRNRMRQDIDSMGMTVQIRVIPQYNLKKTLWFDEHYEGSSIFNKGLVFEITPQANSSKVMFRWLGQNKDNNPGTELQWKKTNSKITDGYMATIGFEEPMIRGCFRLLVSPWR